MLYCAAFSVVLYITEDWWLISITVVERERERERERVF